MLQKQSLRLDESQEGECTQLRDRLQYELNILTAYQEKNRLQAQSQRDRERRELEERVNVRRALLESKVSYQNNHLNILLNANKLGKFIQMETELQQFNKERSERILALKDKHERQLEQFDVDSASMGFR